MKVDPQWQWGGVIRDLKGKKLLRKIYPWGPGIELHYMLCSIIGILVCRLHGLRAKFVYMDCNGNVIVFVKFRCEMENQLCRLLRCWFSDCWQHIKHYKSIFLGASSSASFISSAGLWNSRSTRYPHSRSWLHQWRLWTIIQRRIQTN